ncbi:BP74-related protein [Tardiphaga sp. 862_B3_N4_1]|jgi:hypothetical protein|uniref:BP74-related protein n=1 Tax=Tardiphaga TaxID=1395974 RepID=UPI00285A1CDA|nr:calmodulin [Tardiphaga robiniae]MDR6660031.1 hypothetical protein [Tardiphaga robiniae]
MAYFRCYQQSIHKSFVIQLETEALVKEARGFVSGKLAAKSVMGRIVKETRLYNAPWSWHLDPPTIEFFETTTEVCDASILDVEAHLADVGGSFLPKNVWCPWQSRVIEEVRFSFFGLKTIA